MATMTFSLPDDVKEYVEAHVGEDFADAGEFVAELVRRDRESRLGELRKIVDEGLASGISESTVDQIFDAAVERVRARGALRD